ncbi:leucine-rich repeat receptor-like serine/threonine-protein kinase BAM2 [Selaginella moellendorffii]|uniref:leucine-rich repeat receptor-like serine/threonine-protein kinase BAM2 n=1 Tax=Selaginella moellendorffii TaxID=88036 RepID=UPI000D1D0671|nr:leucine-rich repeat receptor-like serine/threonine-protein kinase BAM2 [Selaginella moellendorffii]|eukprot:XP_024514808.1 leucine-rich repeat receptor-like serine/threonine-protein kinase BAM2 [Selaginella moellendorffii]
MDWSVALSILLLLAASSSVARGFQDKSALLALKAAMIDSSGSLDDWTETDDTPCLWTGITCDDRLSRVVALDLSNKNLSGIFSSSIGRLTELINLTLDVNNFTGNLPSELATLHDLHFLNVSHNTFTGDFPGRFSNLQLLEVLDAYNNNFSGPLPIELSRLPNLRHLHLGGSYFEGEIPPSYGNMTSLSYLALCGNCLVGPIPPELGYLVGLEELYLGYFNHFTGGIPPELGRLLNLQKLDIASCGLEGVIPAELGNLSNLDSLFLQINHLSGPIPPQLGDLVNLKSLDLSNNNLTGAIPIELRKLQNLELLSLFLNGLSGEIPAFVADLPNLQALLLWTNNFTGELPQRLGENMNLTELDVSSNPLTGPLPPNLCKGGQLEVLVLIENGITGTIPPALGHCKSLIKVRLAGNHLTGPIPEGLLGLKMLEMLELLDNRLTGMIPAIVDAPLLDFLDLSQNELQGSIPAGVARLPSLQKLFLHSNQFVGGIPVELGQLSHLLHLDLHSNRLSGAIPAELAQCSKLNYLDVSDNRLTGPIPAELGSMEVLELLNVSRNRLSGGIPPQILGQESLTSADFSYNDFSGTVPSDGHFGSLNMSSFVGNPGLCASLKCGGGDPSSSQDGDGVALSHARARLWKAVVASIFSAAMLFLIVGVVCFVRGNGGEQIECLSICQRRESTGRRWKLTAFQRLEFDAVHVLDSLIEDNIIGRGGSGTVYRAEMPNGEVVAVKRLCKATSDETGSGSHDHGFSAEIQTLGKIRHRNIVKLLGCCSNEETNLLVYEYMPNGSLGELLHSKKRNLLDWTTRYSIAVQSAFGLCYLHHDCSPLIVHRDVKSNNILLDSGFEAHVADFGLAKFFQASSAGKCESMSSIAGSYGYIAPEYAYTLKVSEKADIFSFGVVLLELITGRKPTEQEFRDSGLGIVKWVKKVMDEAKDGVLSIVDSTLRSSQLPVHEVTSLVGVALICCEEYPSDRPTMRDVVQMLVDVRGLPKSSKSGSFKDSSIKTPVESQQQWEDQDREEQQRQRRDQAPLIPL